MCISQIFPLISPNTIWDIIFDGMVWNWSLQPDSDLYFTRIDNLKRNIFIVQ